jgi:hypothetical protein
MLRTELANILIANQALKNRKYLVEDKNGASKTILINTRIIEGNAELGKRVFVIADEVRD